MDVKELKALIRCPKQYDLNKRIRHREMQKRNVYEKGLTLLKECLRHNKTWDICTEKLSDLFRQELQETWFELPWQKERETCERLEILQQVYKWLRTFPFSKADWDRLLSMKYCTEIEGQRFTELSTMCDVFFEEDTKVTAIFLREQFTELLQVKSWKKNMGIELELVIPLLVLQKEYPEKEVELLYASIQPRKDTNKTILEFDEFYENHVVRFVSDTKLNFWRNDEVNEITKLMQHVKKCGCGGCCYNSICHFPVPVWKQESSQMSEIKEDMHYTSSQKEAIQHFYGPLRIAAGPGAGKTEVLTARVSNLISKGVPPERILAVTFTKKVAKELLSRMDFPAKPNVTTLHALGYKIIRQSQHFLGKKKLVNKVDCMRILMHVLKQAPRIKGFNYRKMTGKRGMLNLLFRDFTYINRNGVQKLKEAFPEKDVDTIEVVKSMYDQQYRKASYIMYEVQISLAVYILQAYPSVRRRMQESFDYILIDEAQDLDEMQEKLICLLIGDFNNNIAIYGDTDQLIYGFRGSSNHFMLRFDELYPETKDIRLTDNFRSTKEILQTSNRLISHNSERLDFEMKAHVSGQVAPTYIREFHSNKIGLFIEDMKKEGYRAGDIAVIARTNKELRSMCIMLDAYNATVSEAQRIQYDYPKFYLYQDYTFCVLLDLLTVFHGGYTDDMVLYRLLMIQGIVPEKKNIENSLYNDYLQRQLIYSFESEEQSRYLIASAEQTDTLKAFAKIYRAKSFLSLPVRDGFRKAIDYFCDGKIDNSDAMEVLDDIICERSIQSSFGLWEYLLAIQKFEDDTRISYQSGYEERVHFLTAHDSKGKEFPVVLVYGVDMFDSNDIEEDRRLLYVAMTRARKRLFLTEERRGKSMLLLEIKENLDVLEGSRYA